MMTNDMADTEKLSQYIAEARGMGIEVLPPDVNESQVYFAPAQSGAGVPPAQPAGPASAEDRRDARPTLAIRFGLAAIKGVGEIAVEAILKAPQRRREVPIAGQPVRARGRPLGESQGPGGADQIAARAIAWARRARRCLRKSTGRWRARRASSRTGSAGRLRCSARWRTARRQMPESDDQPAGMAGARIARAREGVARVSTSPGIR